MSTFDFTYIDNEGDTYSSDEFNTLSEARQAWKEIKAEYDGDCRIDETWEYNSDGDFVGRPRI